MREIKTLADPAGVLNPGVVIADDPHAHLRHLKTTATVEEEVDRCVECGFCEPVCPSTDLTLTPRQRIVARRAEAAMREAGDKETADKLAADYTYEGMQTCAADGMCATACPVGIDTGSLVRRLRGEHRGAPAQALGRIATQHWSSATLTAARGISAAKRVPKAAAAASRLGRRVAGAEAVPLWSDDLPGGGRRRRGLLVPHAQVVLMPTCTSTMFGDDEVAADAFMTLCRRAGVAVMVPENVSSMCCGMPWSSKGLSAGAATMSSTVEEALHLATRGGELLVVTDAASCSEGLMKSLDGSGITIEDAVAFTARVLLPALSPNRTVGRLALHPTCSSTRAGINDALHAVAAAVAADVFLPPSWRCCAFAGDRGLLHPEHTASATATQAAEVRAYDADAHASCNRTCELGMSRATGHTYRHVLTLLEEATQ
jgi:D-lactate dehydrogenase